MQPLISIIMAVYNGEKYIADTIESIQSQIYKNFELIIINDCSTDQTQNIVESIVDTRIIILKNTTNKKLAYSLNRGISVAKGKYIARIDADDLCMPTRFVEQVNFLEKHIEIDVLGGNYKAIGNSNKKSHYPQKHEWIKIGLLFDNTMCHPAIMFRRENIKQWYDISVIAGQDYDLWTRLIFQNNFENMNNIVIQYRIHENQTKKIMPNKQKEGANVARNRMLDHFEITKKQEFIEFCNLSTCITKQKFLQYCKVLCEIEENFKDQESKEIFHYFMQKKIWENLINQYRMKNKIKVLIFLLKNHFTYLYKNPKSFYYVMRGALFNV